MTPKANTSIFIDTIPFIMYSRAIYPLNGQTKMEPQQRKIMEIKERKRQETAFMKYT